MSFDIALSGIKAINTSLDTVSNNIANSGTFGFKSSRANFASMYAGSQPTGTEIASLTQSTDIGGSVLTTGRDLDAAIQGRGFFATRDTSGAMAYTRVGSFSTDKSGYIVDSFGRMLQGYAVVPGNPALGALGNLQVPNGQIPAKATDTMKYVGNLSADWPTPAVAPFDPANPMTFNSSIVSVVYDTLGSQHSMTQYFVHTGAGAVDVHYTFDGATPPAPSDKSSLTFDANGQMTSPPQVTLTVTGGPLANGATMPAINLDYTGTTQFAGEATTTVNNTNGYASGLLIGVKIGEDGSVNAQYSNGRKQTVGMVALATFPDEHALEPISNTSWTSTTASGNPLFFTPGTGMAGKLTGGALEQSNVDIASELVGLMTAQRNYQANAKVITTANQMMQSLMQAV